MITFNFIKSWYEARSEGIEWGTIYRGTKKYLKSPEGRFELVIWGMMDTLAFTVIVPIILGILGY